MKICTEATETRLSLVRSVDVESPPSPGMPTTAEAYWRSLYERERARAEGAEARCEELRLKEVASRARAGSLKWCLENCRMKLAARVKKLKEVRRAAKDARAEVVRLEKQLAAAEPGRRSPLESLRKEAARLRRVVEKRDKTIASLREELEGRRRMSPGWRIGWPGRRWRRRITRRRFSIVTRNLSGSTGSCGNRATICVSPSGPPLE